MKLFYELRKMTVLALGLGIVFGLMLLSACGDDDGGGTVDPSAQFVGQYNITGATFVNTTTIILPVNDTLVAPVDFPAGADASTVVLAGLFDTAPTCADPTNTGIELQADGTSDLVCVGETVASTPQGTWAYDATNNEISISVGPPAAAIPLTVLIENIALAGTNLTGTATNFPLPMDATMPLGATNIQFVEIQLTLIKRN